MIESIVVSLEFAAAAQPPAMPFNDRLFAPLSELDREFMSIWTDALKCPPEQEDSSIASREYHILNISMLTNHEKKE